MSLDRRYGVIQGALLTPGQFTDQETSGAIYHADGTLVADAVREPLMWRSIDPATIPRTLVTTLTFDEAIYCGRLLNHFGHFLIETMPSLLWAIGSKMPVLMHAWKGVRGDIPGYVQFALSALGIDSTRIFCVTENVRVKRLLLPPQVRAFHPDDFSFPMTACAFRLLSASAEPARKRNRHVFFSRKFQENRAHHETDAIEEIFQQSGFEIVAPERLDFPQQIRLTKESSFIAGLDGSALHLCGFMNGGICLMLQNRGGQLKVFEFVNATAGVKTVRFDVRGNFDPAALRATIARCEGELGEAQALT